MDTVLQCTGKASRPERLRDWQQVASQLWLHRLGQNGFVQIANHEQMGHLLTAITGYQMAKNLRTKIPDSDTMYIHDVNTAALDSFVKEVGKVTIAKNVREVAENTVCLASSLPQLFWEKPERDSYDDLLFP